MLLFDVGSSEGARSAAERLQQALVGAFTIDGQSVFGTASMGIALSASGYEGADELVRGAHIALFQANADGRTRIAVFDPATREQIVTRQQLETDLHQAIERQEFCLNFQPIVSLATGSLVGFEALVRWRHPLEGIIPPASFIPLAEETGLIVHITRWVLREACRQARVWREQLPTDVDFYLSVNLSVQDLRQPDLSDFVANALQEAGLPPGVLRLEVTESMMIDNINAVSDLVSRLRTMQVPLLLDDFGTGYSSLSYLNRFKFDYLKIDRTFVNRMTHPDQSVGIVRAIVHLAHDLGIKTIAEGVETAEHRDQLKCLGCDYGQGYYFSKPLPHDLAERLLLSRTSW
jgi:EAL domain-containing protein (putative c-di-GMP-specific phosphodiesterase class I)